MYPFATKLRPGSWLCLLLFVALLTGAALAQQSGDVSSSASKSSTGDNLQTFSINVNVVNIFFNVKDKHGALIASLPKDQFSIFEDGKPQTIKYFASESNLPLTLGILLDTSVSQERVLSSEKEVGASFLHEVLRPKDLAFLISFDVNVDLLQDLTNSDSLLRDGLNHSQINSGGGGGSLPGLGGGPFPTSVPKGTLLYDAIYLGAHEKLANEVGRKAMIILTDGVDQGSEMDLRQAIEAAQKADAMTYVILIADRGFYGGMGYSGDDDMKKLVQECGGRVIEVGDKPEKLRSAFDQIAAELRSQYSVGYTPTNTARDGKFRKVEIRTKDHDYKVQARSGYFAPSSN